MRLKNSGAEFYVPDGRPIGEAVARTTHMAVSAHQDDIELMALDGILRCYGNEEEWFFGVVATNGAGSPRNGRYANYTGEEMQEVRRLEQKKAADIGEYGALALLDYTSSDVKNTENTGIIEELRELVSASRPKVIYTHNLADKHDTHVATAIKTILALRGLPAALHPEKLYGCEVWRSLDWVDDSDKVVFDVSSNTDLSAALIRVFDSQISGGKRYDLAAAGRRLANATFGASHATDASSALIYGMDLTPLIKDPGIDIKEYIAGYINSFAKDVSHRLTKLI